MIPHPAGLRQRRRVVGNLGVPGDFLVRGRIVDEHHGVLLLGVLEEEVYAFLLQQPAQEVERRLAILDAVGKLLVRALEGKAKIGEAVLAGQ